MTHISKIYVRTAKSLNRTEQIKYIFDYDCGKGETRGEVEWTIGELDTVTLVKKQVKLKNSLPTTLDTQILLFSLLVLVCVCV